MIQRILRHANVSTTATYYIKTAADDVRSAMATLQKHVPDAAAVLQDTIGTPKSAMAVDPSTVQ